MKVRRRCSVCGKIRICRVNNFAKVKFNTQKLCYKCQRAYFKEWYEENKEELCERRRIKYANNK